MLDYEELDQDTQHMVEEYSSMQEVILVLLKPKNRTSTYHAERIAVKFKASQSLMRKATTSSHYIAYRYVSTPARTKMKGAPSY